MSTTFYKDYAIENRGKRNIVNMKLSRYELRILQGTRVKTWYGKKKFKDTWIEKNSMVTLFYFVISHCAIRCYSFWAELKQYQSSIQVG